MPQLPLELGARRLAGFSTLLARHMVELEDKRQKAHIKFMVMHDIAQFRASAGPEAARDQHKQANKDLRHLLALQKTAPHNSEARWRLLGRILSVFFVAVQVLANLRARASVAPEQLLHGLPLAAFGDGRADRV